MNDKGTLQAKQWYMLFWSIVTVIVLSVCIWFGVQINQINNNLLKLKNCACACGGMEAIEKGCEE